MQADCIADGRLTRRPHPAGASRRCNRRRKVTKAVARVQGGAADGPDPYRSSDSVDAEWQVLLSFSMGQAGKGAFVSIS